jgi:hypothetical protein
MIHFHDPYFSKSYTLHETLIQFCATTIHGKVAVQNYPISTVLTV